MAPRCVKFLLVALLLVCWSVSVVVGVVLPRWYQIGVTVCVVKYTIVYLPRYQLPHYI